MVSPSMMRTTTPSRAVADAVPRAVYAPNTPAMAARRRASTLATIARRERSEPARTMATRCHTVSLTVYLWIRLRRDRAAVRDGRRDDGGEPAQRERLRDVVEGALPQRRPCEIVVAHPAQHDDRCFVDERAEQ